MFCEKNKPPIRSAAWRITLWATLAFATGTMLVFILLHVFVAQVLQRNSDAWLSGEVEVLSNVAQHTPNDRLYRRVVGEVAELASREVATRLPNGQSDTNSVFFLLTSAQGSPTLWVGPGDGSQYLAAIRSGRITPGQPTDIHVADQSIPFRVASVAMSNGSVIYLGLSERDQHRVLRLLRIHILVLWLIVVFLGAAIVFYVTRKMLGDVRRITEAASRIGESDLSQRVPTIQRRDEAGHLAATLNTMLDRIQNSMQQLHTITDSLAHDLRSPLTAVRAHLERSLTAETSEESETSLVAAMEELDRLTELLTISLDVAEAKADALRLVRKPIDLDQALRKVAELYAPCMAEKRLLLQLDSPGPLLVSCDQGLLHRMLGNLLDNELKHLPENCIVQLQLQRHANQAVLVVEDNGPGFARELTGRMFEARTRGQFSSGHGLGLSFVEAVVRSHGGSATAWNRPEGGAHVSVSLPLATAQETLAEAAFVQA